MWQDDYEAVNAFDDMLSSINAPMSHWLTMMHPHADQSMQWLTLFTMGRFVRVYNQMRDQGEEPLIAYNSAIASCLSDPQVQQAIANMTQQAVEGGFRGF